ncbi:MAG: hypothetical protein KGM42_19920 [Hyphomicrobiales bacterium]|nr:hypothetical protein [Hyphomicrobiales bacterium]
MTFLRRLLVCLVLFGAALAAPALWLETACVAPQSGDAPDFAGWQRQDEARVYSDLAVIARRSSPSDFDYGSAIGGFWRGLCAARGGEKAASLALDDKIAAYLSADVFTLGLGLRGVWERTIGAATLWLRGPYRTSEDEFELNALDAYAAFLKDRPWYDYPYTDEISHFWRDVASSGIAYPRKWDRRAEFSLEYWFKAGAAPIVRSLTPAPGGQVASAESALRPSLQ